MRVNHDGNEFEVTWLVPQEAWGDYDGEATTVRLDLDAEVAHWVDASARGRDALALVNERGDGR